MPTVPRYDSAPIQQAGLPGVKVPTDAPLSAFGGGAYLDQTTKAAQGLGSAITDVAKEEKEKADLTAHIDQNNQLATASNNIQVSLSKLQGKDALNAPDVAKQQWDQAVQTISPSAANDTQKMAFERAAADQGQQLNKFALMHAAGQTQKYQSDLLDSTISTSKDAAVLNAVDDQRVNTELQRQAAVYQDIAKVKGIPQVGPDGKPNPLYEEGLKNILSSTHTDVINARIDSDMDKGAQDYFDQHKDQMTAADQVKTEKILEARKTVAEGMQTWNDLKNVKLSDGTPDEAKMQSKIMNDPNMSDEKKEKIWEFVKARAGEQIVDKAKQDQARDRSFLDSAIKARQQGVALPDALKMVPKFSSDLYDQSVKADALRKLYAPPTESDPSTYMSIWQNVQDGKASKDQIDSAMQKNLINASDWKSLRQENYRITVEGKSPEMKSTDERIKSLAESQYGSNKQERDQFEYMVRVGAQGKSPQETLKYANDLVQKDQNTGFWGFGQKPKWQAELSKTDSTNLAWGKAQEDVGLDQVRAIGNGLTQTNKKPFGVGDFDSFAAQFGGYNNIKVGTPVNNAVQSLSKKGKLVNPDTVRSVLQRYPDGKF